ncbi:MAG: hypothetical protein VX466_06205, partial [Myxococcota bacterium]|nr:hypothetical protein [Myxococcota bacterium]
MFKQLLPLSSLSLLLLAATPAAVRADLAPWGMLESGPNEVVYTLDISCTGVGLVCGALDAYTDVQVATLSGSGEIDIDATAGTLQFVQDGTQDV